MHRQWHIFLDFYVPVQFLLCWNPTRSQPGKNTVYRMEKFIHWNGENDFFLWIPLLASKLLNISSLEHQKVGVAKITRLINNISANIHSRIIYHVSFKQAWIKIFFQRKAFSFWKLVIILKQWNKIKSHKKRKKCKKLNNKKCISTLLVKFDVQINYFS